MHKPKGSPGLGVAVRFEFSGGFLIYRNSRAGPTFLFLKRKDGFLDIPKGHIEEGEDAREAAIRETYEEASLKGESIDQFYRYDYWVWFQRDGEKIKKKISVFLAGVKQDAKVKVSYEHVGYLWLGYEDAMKAKLFDQEKLATKSAYDYLSKKGMVEGINEEYRKLPERYKSWDLSRRFVPGEGPVNAAIMVVGQAPGATEDQKGRPFVGRSGELLNHLLRLAGTRREDVYITSVVQFFPPKNRIPDRREVEACRGFLIRQINAISPKLIVTLGNLPASVLLGSSRIMKSHGTITKKAGMAYFTTLHPAAAVRIRSNLPIIEGDFRKLKGIIKRIGVT